MNKRLILALVVLLTTIVNAQKKNKDYIFGYITSEEYELKKYPLDTTANAVVLYEIGNSVFKVDDDNIFIETTYYSKIKIFNKEGFEHANFKIPIYNNDNHSEKVINIKGTTSNNYSKTHLAKSNIFNERENENWSYVKFTLPNLKAGSIIEVEYTLKTPFKFNLTGWEFQSSIPKVLSIYKAQIPGNYVYNRKKKGKIHLKTNSSTLKKKCFRVPWYNSAVADCEDVEYSAENIPAFIEEDYMTDPDNFKSQIKFELSEFKWFDGTKKKYSKTWADVDKEFKTDKNIGTQLKKVSFFENKLPEDIKSLPNTLEKAKKVYYFIQNHFSWNKKYRLFSEVRVKKAFEEQVGNVGEINISLINALKAAGFNAELVALSTRNNGFATKLYPVISDFNYAIAKLNIDNKYYLLDATDKNLPFNLLPFRCLNGSGRAMDFENDSYWVDIIPNESNKTSLTSYLELKEDGTIVGKLRKYHSGYNSFLRRKEIEESNEDDLISEFEDSFNNLEVLNYEILNKNDKEKPLTELIEIKIKTSNNPSTIFVNPYFDEKFSKNPFKQKNRFYPVDFGYKREYSTILSIEIPDNYQLNYYPEEMGITLEEEGGELNVFSKKLNDYKYTLKSRFKLKKPIYYNFEYQGLKEIFRRVINAQKESLVISKN
ncbi:DUF3857 domain-containing protein [Lutibacter sp. TH_r2]|uniref:transglutaminase domain-containing protein n=1 Tax=Lutibacter sp. TH_r2 TaxID=3082083 RepID=UPI002952D3C5|nr:DUF3857 domain-containing protein [Lutibacter sp. TH_r2]MDV7187527.1 DUF3857 domain-containing protein [Lutibacter sp. TH_r2]